MVAPLYAALADLRAMLNLADDDTSRDNLLTTALTAACRGIDRATGRRFYLDETPTARLYRPAGRTVCGSDGERLVVDDIGSDTGLVVETGTADAWTPVTGYETGPDNALARGRPVTALLTTASWGSGATRVRVTAQWGWPDVPEEIEQASLIQAARLYRRKDSPEGVTGSAEWGVVRLSRRDPDVWALIEHFIVPGFG
ncbi:phage gp6-like head-tail connector protein [Streptomyces venezuelae]|uniref:phage gp6-like head-tail connector protein n=1 Tax=Streptomyces sp. B6(2022) TaxID=3404749 RepID=UPI0031205188